MKLNQTSFRLLDIKAEEVLRLELPADASVQLWHDGLRQALPITPTELRRVLTNASLELRFDAGWCLGTLVVKVH